MKITKRQLKRIIKESEQYVDEDGNIWDDEGNVTRRGSEFGSRYGGDTYDANAPWKQSGGQKPAKATFVGDGANGTQIAAVEKALEVKPDNFLTSILKQLKQGRKLSVKQKSIVGKILAKSNATAAQLFEAGPDKIRVTKAQLKSIIKEEASRLLREEEEEKISATDFVKAMKEDLPSMMKLVPDAMNDDLMNAIRALVAASKYDTSAFKAAIAIVMTKTEKAQEKIKEQA